MVILHPFTYIKRIAGLFKDFVNFDDDNFIIDNSDYINFLDLIINGEISACLINNCYEISTELYGIDYKLWITDNSGRGYPYFNNYLAGLYRGSNEKPEYSISHQGTCL